MTGAGRDREEGPNGRSGSSREGRLEPKPKSGPNEGNGRERREKKNGRDEENEHERTQKIRQIYRELRALDLIGPMKLCRAPLPAAGPAGPESAGAEPAADSEPADSDSVGSEAAAAAEPAVLAALIDHTCLKPEAERSDILRFCREAVEYGMKAVCVNPYWVSEAAALLDGTGVSVCTVAGFPLGASSPETKIKEAAGAAADGADELDMVINLGAFKSERWDLVVDEVRRVGEAFRQAGGGVLKVIIETALLTDEEKIRACLLVREAGADFVKTSTGFGPGGATLADVNLLNDVCAGWIGIKASAGIRTAADVRAMVAAGATRIGTSSGLEILQQFRPGPSDSLSANPRDLRPE